MMGTFSTPKRKTVSQLQNECDIFNSENAVGSDVFVKLDAVYEPFRTKTRSEAQIMCGHTAVIWLDGVSGAYKLDRVTSASQATERPAANRPKKPDQAD